MLRAPPLYLVIQLAFLQVIAMLCIFFLMVIALWGLDYAGYIVEHEHLLGYTVLSSAIAGAWVVSIAHHYVEDESVKEIVLTDKRRKKV